MTIQEFKKQFNQNSPYIHFNNSGQAPVPEAYRRKLQLWLDRFYHEAAFCSPAGWAEVENVRSKLARFIGAETEEISFVQTTASALSQAALGIELKTDDEILTWQQEYPSNFYPWRMAAEKSGAKLIQIETPDYDTPVERLLERVTNKTKVIAVSWVQYQTGSVTDLKKLSTALKGRNIWLTADIIQGLGVREFNFAESGFDVVACGSHKWMCSGYGAAFMAVKKEKMEQLKPLEFGAMSFGDPDTPKNLTIPLKTGGQRFEPGSKSMFEIIAMAESIRLLQDAGMKNIEAEAHRLAANLRQGLKDLGYEVFNPQTGPIVNWSYTQKMTPDISGANRAMAEKLKQNKISYALRGPGVRFSVHAFNTDEEVSRVLELMS